MLDGAGGQNRNQSHHCHSPVHDLRLHGEARVEFGDDAVGLLVLLAVLEEELVTAMATSE